MNEKIVFEAIQLKEKEFEPCQPKCEWHKGWDACKDFLFTLLCKQEDLTVQEVYSQFDVREENI